jgi:hypothetical protein
MATGDEQRAAPDGISLSPRDAAAEDRDRASEERRAIRCCAKSSSASAKTCAPMTSSLGSAATSSSAHSRDRASSRPKSDMSRSHSSSASAQMEPGSRSALPHTNGATRSRAWLIELTKRCSPNPASGVWGMRWWGGVKAGWMVAPPRGQTSRRPMNARGTVTCQWRVGDHGRPQRALNRPAGRVPHRDAREGRRRFRGRIGCLSRPPSPRQSPPRSSPAGSCGR